MINSTGLPRRIDHLGRIVVPVELRRMLGINAGDELEIAVKGDAITLTRVRQGCVFCGSEEDLQVFHDKPVCGSCASQAAARFNGAAGQESGHHTNGSHQMGSQSSPN